MPDSYESEALLRQYLDFHYRSGDPGYLPHHPLPPGVLEYPRRCAEKVLQYSRRFDRALDPGCAVGGSTFVLATRFQEVVGVDLSASFIRTATALAQHGVFRLPEPFRHGNGQGLSEETYTLPSELRNTSPRFEQGDACALRPDLGCFDAILMANLLCRLPDPAACLQNLRNHTRPGSLLVFMTPCSWDEDFTPREKWLFPTLEALHQHLDPWCGCLEVSEMPFVLRDHERRAQFTVAQCSVWEVAQA
ncbi:MAG: methyltransferase domain-containing protein [Kiritimatiellia bacterium]